MLAKFSVKKPYTVIVGIILVIALGVISFQNMTTDLLPNMNVWNDNLDTSKWYYLDVQEATNSHYYKFKTNSKYEKWSELRETRDWTQLEK